MKRTEIDALLRELRGATTRARARMLQASLSAAAKRLDEQQREELRRCALLQGLPVPDLPAGTLDVGETWLLLFEPPAGGCVARVTATFDGGTTNQQLATEIRRAHRGLVSTVAGLGRRLDQIEPPAIEIDAPYPADAFEVEGSSLGLSVAVASLSAASRRAADTWIAGSARVLDTGELRPVEHLGPKLTALRASRPEVKRLLVARDQVRPHDSFGLEWIEAKNLAEALPHFGLALELLPKGKIENIQAWVHGLGSENAKTKTLMEWTNLGLRAWEAADILASRDPVGSGQARTWAAMFFVHGSDSAGADAALRLIDDASAKQFPELHARNRIAAATAAIDRDNFPVAIEAAAEGVRLCEALDARERAQLLGQALGTHGRVHLHAGEYDVAAPLLFRALEHHRTHAPRYAPADVARSACYLATCRRLQGHLDEALAIVDDALRQVEVLAEDFDLATTTRLFLRLERARVHITAASWDTAMTDLAVVLAGQADEASYPRLGAQRHMPLVLRALGRVGEADDALDACIAIARKLDGHRSTLARVATVAAGEALLGGLIWRTPHDELTAVWCSAFGGTATAAELAERVRTWIY